MRSDAIVQVPALVLAAGRSTRVASVLGGRSKVLFDIDGETVLERNLRWLAASGIRSVWINLHYQPDAVRAAASDGSRFGLSVSYEYEPELRGTAGAFRALAPRLPGTTLVVYGDNVSGFDLRRLMERHWSAGDVATVALFDSTVHANSGIAGGRVIVEDGCVIDFIEGADGDCHSSLVNAGVYALEPEILAYMPATVAPDFGKDVFPALLAAKQRLTSHVIEPEGYCFGIDTPESLQRTRASLELRSTQSR